jgi:Fe-S-cluster containining protein
MPDQDPILRLEHIIYQTTRNLLGNDKSKSTLIKIAEQAAKFAEELIEAVKKIDQPRLACHEGCAWCCYMEVGVTVPEVVRILDYLEQNFSREELNKLKATVINQDEQTRQLNKLQRLQARLPCIFLQDKKCTIYPVRPLSCIGWNSMDEATCKQYVKNPEKKQGRLRQSAKAYQSQRVISIAADMGLGKALHAENLDSHLMRLTGAMRLLLQNGEISEEDIISKWSNGLDAFNSAHLEEEQV